MLVERRLITGRLALTAIQESPVSLLVAVMQPGKCRVVGAEYIEGAMVSKWYNPVPGGFNSDQRLFFKIVYTYAPEACKHIDVYASRILDIGCDSTRPVDAELAAIHHLQNEEPGLWADYRVAIGLARDALMLLRS
jgi:hypothetical protein